MYDKIILMLKGVIIGVANIIPGVSGGTLAITLGLYEKLIHAVNTFFKELKKNIMFLIPFGIGVVIGILLVSKLIVLAFDNYPVQTNIFFVGLILGGLPMLFNKVKGKEKSTSNFLILILIIVLLIGLTFIDGGNEVVFFENLVAYDYFKLFIVGIIAAATIVIPGISGSLVLMIMGYYRPLLDMISTLATFYKLSFNELFNYGLILAPFGIGLILGVFLIAKLIEYLLTHHETTTYYAIIGFVIGSILLILQPLLTYNLTLITVISSAVFGIGGYIIANLLGER